MRIACIVEGHGEVEALPLLVRRIAAEAHAYADVLPPMRVPASKLIKEGELERAVEFSARKCGRGGGILIVLDCDDGCPAQMGPQLLSRARRTRDDLHIAVVLAKREYEAWFLAAAASIAGCRGLPDVLPPPDNPEAIRDAKGWLADRMKDGSYAETTDQAALTAAFDIALARQAPSFDKCWREIMTLIQVG